ncbi:hypothetical protein ACE34W_000928 [Vibrio parahaemolyticus]|nr:hypothetical protein [Vibrio parahaemolyticus]
MVHNIDDQLQTEWQMLWPDYVTKGGSVKPTTPLAVKQAIYDYRIKAFGIVRLEALSEKRTNTTHVLHCCSCGNDQWRSTPSNVLSGFTCKECGIPRRTKNNKKGEENYRAQLVKLNNGVDLLGTYESRNTPTLHRCSCGNDEWMATPQSVLRGSRCNRCRDRRAAKAISSARKGIKHTGDVVVQRRETKRVKYIEKLTKLAPNVELIGPFIREGLRTRHRCSCGNDEWMVHPYRVLQGARCRHCSSQERARNGLEQYLVQLPEGVELIGQFNGLSKKAQHRCKCGNEDWMAYPADVLKGVLCKKCLPQRQGKAISFAKKEPETQRDNYVAKLAEFAPDIALLGEFNGISKATLHRCSCGNDEWMVRPYRVLEGGRCRHCSSQERARNGLEQYLLQLPEGVELIGQFNGLSKKAQHRCKCGNEDWMAYPADVLNGGMCGQCKHTRASMQRKRTASEYDLLLESTSTGVELLGEYKGHNEVTLHRCSCGNDKWKVKPANVLSGKRCNKCALDRAREYNLMPEKDYKKRLAYLGNGVRLIGPYLGCNVHTQHYCPCGNQDWKPKPSNVLSGRLCGECAPERLGDARRKDLTVYQAEIAELGFELLGEYINNQVLTRHRCSCGNEQWEVAPGNVLSGHRCSECATSATDNDMLYNWTDDEGNIKTGLSSWRLGDSRPKDCARNRNTSVSNLRMIWLPNARRVETMILKRWFPLDSHGCYDSGDGKEEFRTLSSKEKRKLDRLFDRLAQLYPQPNSNG